MSDTDSIPTEAACFERLQKRLEGLAADDSQVIAAVRPHCSCVRFMARQHLLEAGAVARSVYYLCEGLVRFYYLTGDGKEHNKSFACEGQFAGALQASHAPEPSRFFIQALEPVTALAISLDGLDRLYRESLTWANIGRLYLEGVAVRKAQREGEFLLDSAEQRYRRFVETEPELARRLPLYHVASYLGITDVALSRIRRRIKRDDV